MTAYQLLIDLQTAMAEGRVEPSAAVVVEVPRPGAGDGVVRVPAGPGYATADGRFAVPVVLPVARPPARG